MPEKPPLNQFNYPKNIGIMLKTTRKILLSLNLIDESVYMRKYIKEKFLSLIKWILTLILNGILWCIALSWVYFLDIKRLSLVSLPYLIISFGVFRFMIKGLYDYVRR